MPAKKKIYVLDTNVLIHDPKSLFHFEGVQIGIPATVLEELDHFKGEGTERGRNTREAIRFLDKLREKGSLHDGVTLDNGCVLTVLFYNDEGLKKIPLSSTLADNKILLTALALKKEGNEVIFISKDLNARVKADAIGLATEDYIKEHVSEKEFYQGWIKVAVPAVELKGEFPKELISFAKKGVIQRNEYVLAESQNNPHNYRIYRYYGGEVFKPLSIPQLIWPLAPRNPQQYMALDLLLDKDVQFMCLFGPAGTGKTFLALLAGLHQVFINKQYEHMVISRPVIPLGRDIGYLPGTVSEKLHSWMMPIYDNMSYIMHTINKSQKHDQEQQAENHNHKKKEKKGNHQDQKKPRMITFDDLLHQGKISMEAITYMRGRTIPYQYILIDEAQNLNPHEIKTLVTRAGEGSKIILTGDPYQIDSPYLDFSSNGLVTASEKFKGQKIFGSVFLPVSERSELSKLAGELL